jgi:hypothetical protein
MHFNHDMIPGILGVLDIVIMRPSYFTLIDESCRMHAV